MFEKPMNVDDELKVTIYPVNILYRHSNKWKTKYPSVTSTGIVDGDTNGQLICSPHLLGKHLNEKCWIFRKEEKGFFFSWSVWIYVHIILHLIPVILFVEVTEGYFVFHLLLWRYKILTGYIVTSSFLKIQHFSFKCLPNKCGEHINWPFVSPSTMPRERNAR
jgi:hypothetical protein